MSILTQKLRYLAAIGCAVSCGGSEANGVPAGLVVAPTLASGTVTKGPPGDGGADALSSSVAHRALPPEPRAPTGMYGCQRAVHCRPEEDETPVVPFPTPYERCLPSSGKTESSFSVQETSNRRQWDPHTCCYVEFNGCQKTRSMPVPGRPLRNETGDIVMADPAERSDWMIDIERAEADDARARHWLDAAAAEHASIAAFARVSLELLSLGAPPDLVMEAHAAAIDELDHARMCYALAARYGSSAHGPGPLDVPAMAKVTRTDLAKSAMLDGFANEARASHEARERALQERDPVARAILERIADDEERHAALGLKIAKWAAPDEALVTEAIASLPDDLFARDLIAPCLRALL